MKGGEMPIAARAFVRSQLLYLAVGLLALAAIVGVAFWLGERSGEIAGEILAARDLKTASVELGALVQRAESSAATSSPITRFISLPAISPRPRPCAASRLYRPA